MEQADLSRRDMAAYEARCARRLRHGELLDAPRARPTHDAAGLAAFSNGLGLAVHDSHHAPFDMNIPGISPGYVVNRPGGDPDRPVRPVSAQQSADAHQARLRRVLDGVRATRWFHGHHHVRYSSTITAVHGEVQIEGLALDGEPLDELTLLIDADGYPILAS